MTMRILLILAAAVWYSLVAAQPAVPPTAPAPVPPAAAPVPPPGPEPAQPTSGDDKDTIEASKKWLALLDTGKTGTAWDASSAYLKSVVTRQKWIAGITSARKPFGKIDKRTATKFARSHSMPGAPDGDYSIIEFESVFANGKRASEQLIWTLGDGDVWSVSGYFIR
jgi:hypothetical protein